MRMRAGILVALVVSGLVAVVSAGGPASAYSCRNKDPDKRADLIVIGTVTGTTPDDVTLAVESVEKGEPVLGGTLRLVQHQDFNRYDFRVGGRYRVNSVKGQTSSCAGVRGLPAASPVAGAVAQAPVLVEQRRRPWWIAAGTAGVALIAFVAVAVVWRRRRGGQAS